MPDFHQSSVRNRNFFFNFFFCPLQSYFVFPVKLHIEQQTQNQYWEGCLPVCRCLHRVKTMMTQLCLIGLGGANTTEHDPGKPPGGLLGTLPFSFFFSFFSFLFLFLATYIWHGAIVRPSLFRLISGFPRVELQTRTLWRSPVVLNRWTKPSTTCWTWRKNMWVALI